MAQEITVLGGGCFWCLEASYQLVEGVDRVVPGYAGGTSKDPSYYSVQEGRGNHAEVVQITFEAQIISYSELLDIFWVIHDPTTLNRQGNDVGPQYRSTILYTTPEQKRIAIALRDSVQKLWENPVVTEIKPLDIFYEAEEEDRNYFIRHPDAAYCQVIINPKLDKLRAKFARKLK